MENDISRCIGCPVVKDGEVCKILLSVIDNNKYAFDNPNVRRIEFTCNKANQYSGGMLSVRSYVTRNKAIYGAGSAGDAIIKAFFG